MIIDHIEVDRSALIEALERFPDVLNDFVLHGPGGPSLQLSVGSKAAATQTTGDRRAIGWVVGRLKESTTRRAFGFNGDIFAAQDKLLHCIHGATG